MDSDTDSTAAIEAAVHAKLSTWRTSDDQPLTPTHKKRTKRRKKYSQHTHTVPPSPPPASPTVEPSYTRSTSAIESRLLNQTLLRPRTTNPHSKPSPYVPISKSTETFKPRPRRPLKKSTPVVASKRQPKLDAAEFVESHRREVNRFGSSALNKRDRRTFEIAERMRLGCRAPKREKMPIALLQNKRKKQKMREEKQRELDIATGMLVRSKRRR